MTTSHAPLNDQAHGPGNRLLAALPLPELTQLLSQCHYLNLERGSTLCRRGDPIGRAWFPVDAVASVTASMRFGDTVEVVGVGREGLVGVPALLGARVSPLYCAVEFPGAVWEISADALVRAFQHDSAVQSVLRRYLYFRLVDASQLAACNLLHSAKQRLSMWLLRTRDRLGLDDFAVTHELLSERLGIQRTTVTLAARSLEIAGAIRYKRGNVTIADRQLLERSACECYRIISGQFEQLISPS